MKGAAGRGLRLLEKAGAARARLRRPNASAEDLHALRVALRRLLVHLKAHGKACGASAKARKRLRRIFRSTGPLRDAQVELQWLADHARRSKAEGVDAAALVASAAARREALSVDRAMLSELDRLAARLRRTFRDSGKAASDEERFRRRVEKKARRRALEARERLERMGQEPAAKALHKARIAAKRLRYLIEPVGAVPGLPALEDAKKLQTLLGEIRDRDLIAADLSELRREVPAVEGLAGRAAAQALEEKKALLARARREWRRPVWRAT